MSDETALMKELQIAASQMGARLFRQNTGMAWVGKATRIARPQRVLVNAGDVVIRGARPFHAGREGMSDLGGWHPVIVTEEMVGKPLAVYAQVEVKDGARPTQAQLDWIGMVLRAGGLAGVAHDEIELRQILTAKSGSSD